MIAAAAVTIAACPVPRDAGKYSFSQREAYARRSIEIVALAATGQDSKLGKLMAPDAKFSIWHVDQGLTGNGLRGAHAFAAEVRAATYLVDQDEGFGPVTQRDPCGPQDVGVEFVNFDKTRWTVAKFHYDRGLLRSAEGVWRKRYSGPVRVGIE